MKSKSHKFYKQKSHKISIETRMKLRKAWYILAPILLIAIIVGGYITIQVDLYKDIQHMKEAKYYDNLPSVEENKQVNLKANSEEQTETVYAYQSPISDTDTRVMQKGTGLSFITQADARKIKEGIDYAELNKYGRPGKVTARLTLENAEETDFSNINVDTAVISTNMLLKAFGGETIKENQILMLTEIYESCYAPIMQSIYDYMTNTGNTVIIIITPTWSNVQYNMPDSIRIDAYSPDDFGESLNVNFVIRNIKSGNEITDYRNPENN